MSTTEYVLTIVNVVIPVWFYETEKAADFRTNDNPGLVLNLEKCIMHF